MTEINMGAGRPLDVPVGQAELLGGQETEQAVQAGVGVESLFAGPNLVVHFEEAFQQLCEPLSAAGRAEVLEGMMQAKFEALSHIIDNLKPSDQEIEQRERAKKEALLKELENLLRQVDELKKSENQDAVNEAAAAFAKLLDKDDWQLLESSFAEQCPITA